MDYSKLDYNEYNSHSENSFDNAFAVFKALWRQTRKYHRFLHCVSHNLSVKTNKENCKKMELSNQASTLVKIEPLEKNQTVKAVSSP